MAVTVNQEQLLEPVEQPSRNTQVGADQTAAWANSAAANTEVNVDIAQPSTIRSKYRFQINNPSAETALTVKVRNRVTIGAAERFVEVGSFAVPVGSGREAVIEGAFGGDNGIRIVLSNDTALGLSGAFTANVAVREA
jgi:hypothetical protein